MREAYGGAWIYGIMITFTMIFVAYVAISINYSKVFTAKSHIINIIEQYQGLNSKSLSKIDRQLEIDSYKGNGPCATKKTIKSSVISNNEAYGTGDFVGVTGGSGTFNGAGKYQYCVYKSHAIKSGAGSGVEDYYYMVVTFLKFNFPVLGDIYNLRISGETHAINYPNDESVFWPY